MTLKEKIDLLKADLPALLKEVNFKREKFRRYAEMPNNDLSIVKDLSTEAYAIEGLYAKMYNVIEAFDDFKKAEMRLFIRGVNKNVIINQESKAK